MSRMCFIFFSVVALILIVSVAQVRADGIPIDPVMGVSGVTSRTRTIRADIAHGYTSSRKARQTRRAASKSASEGLPRGRR